MGNHNPPDQWDAVTAAHTLAQADKRLAAVIERVGPPDLRGRNPDDPFLGLLRAIVYQQLSGKAAGTIHRRVLALFEPDPPTPRSLLATPPEDLRAAGLSANKVAAVRDLSDKAVEGVVPSAAALAALDDEAIIERLVQVRGIGRWTVEMLLIFNLGRPDILPVHDLGIRKGAMEICGLEALPAPRWLRDHGQRWAPYRSVASWYLWRAADDAAV